MQTTVFGMNAAWSSPGRRVCLAILLSVLVHAALLWLPPMKLPHEKVISPSLSAGLEPRPTLMAPIAAMESADQAIRPGGTVAARAQKKAAQPMPALEKTEKNHVFPTRLQLVFSVYRDSDLFKVGEIHHQFEIKAGLYHLKSSRETAGMSHLLGHEVLVQESVGRVDEHGLRPETFKQENNGAGGNSRLAATFDWPAQQLHFLAGRDASLPSGAEDILSFMYQLSQIPLQGEIIPMAISDGTQLESIQIEIGSVEAIDTPMGKLRALHLRKMHGRNEAYFEVWLALEYRLLPVKFRQVDGAGYRTEQIVVSDIRGTDD